VLILVALTGGPLGLVLGSVIRPQQIQLMFIVLITPMTFLGATFYSWASINSLPWLKYLLRANPITYANEALRGSMTPGAIHMTIGLSVGGLTLCWSLPRRWALRSS
jgi:ABC-2 type transport system permease protein